MAGSSAPRISPPPVATPPPTPMSDDENARAAAEAIRRREKLAKGRRSTLLSGLGEMDSQRKTLLG